MQKEFEHKYNGRLSNSCTATFCKLLAYCFSAEILLNGYKSILHQQKGRRDNNTTALNSVSVQLYYFTVALFPSMSLTISILLSASWQETCRVAAISDDYSYGMFLVFLLNKNSSEAQSESSFVTTSLREIRAAVRQRCLYIHTRMSTGIPQK